MTLFYEVDGDGEPLVLLHGGMSGSEAWALQRPALVEAGYRVYLPDRPGHGRTPDIDGPWTYDQMTRDTIAFLDEVVGTKAHLVGWSDGAYVAALLAAERPDLVDRMVLIGQYFAPAGATGDLLTELAAFRTDPPDGVRPEMVEKSFDLWSKEPTIPLSAFAAFDAPVLVQHGEPALRDRRRDGVRMLDRHFVEVAL